MPLGITQVKAVCCAYRCAVRAAMAGRLASAGGASVAGMVWP